MMAVEDVSCAVEYSRIFFAIAPAHTVDRLRVLKEMKDKMKVLCLGGRIGRKQGSFATVW